MEEHDVNDTDDEGDGETPTVRDGEGVPEGVGDTEDDGVGDTDPVLDGE